MANHIGQQAINVLSPNVAQTQILANKKTNQIYIQNSSNKIIRDFNSFLNAGFLSKESEDSARTVTLKRLKCRVSMKLKLFLHL